MKQIATRVARILEMRSAQPERVAYFSRYLSVEFPIGQSCRSVVSSKRPYSIVNFCVHSLLVSFSFAPYYLLRWTRQAIVVAMTIVSTSMSPVGHDFSIFSGYCETAARL